MSVDQEDYERCRICKRGYEGGEDNGLLAGGWCESCKTFTGPGTKRWEIAVQAGAAGESNPQGPG